MSDTPMLDWIVLAASVSMAVNLFLIGAFVYHRMTIRNYKAALVQWHRWGAQMRRNLGWTDSFLKTRVMNSAENRTRAKQTPKARPPDGNGPPPIS
jgi:hypothetical protein